MKRFAVMVLGVFTILIGFGKADVIYDISLNTSSLVGNSNAPFALDFQLTSGDVTSGVVNTATVSQFQFGTGGSASTGNPFSNSGNASGSLSSTVTLNTSGGTFFNEFSQYFTPGSSLAFQVDLTNNPQPGSTPDEFSFQLIDNTANEVSTTDASGSNSLLIIDLTGSAIQPLTFTTNGDGATITPIVQTPVSSTPEPKTALLLSVGIALLATAGRVWLRKERGPSMGKTERPGLPNRKPLQAYAYGLELDGQMESLPYSLSDCSVARTD